MPYLGAQGDWGYPQQATLFNKVEACPQEDKVFRGLRFGWDIGKSK
jgi:hypothetical protein